MRASIEKARAALASRHDVTMIATILGGVPLCSRRSGCRGASHSAG